MAGTKAKKPTTLDPNNRIDLVQPKAKVLWLYRGEVEEGEVQFLSNGYAALIWLEGYKSRNDDVKVEDLLSVWAKDAPELAGFPFSGRGHVLPAGRAWLASQQPALA